MKIYNQSADELAAARTSVVGVPSSRRVPSCITDADNKVMCITAHGGTNGSVAEESQNRALGDRSIRLERAARRCIAQVKLGMGCFGKNGRFLGCRS